MFVCTLHFESLDLPVDTFIASRLPANYFLTHKIKVF